MADLSAKDGSQETMVNLLALLVNLTILPVIADHKGGACTTYDNYDIYNIFCKKNSVRFFSFTKI